MKKRMIWSAVLIVIFAVLCTYFKVPGPVYHHEIDVSADTYEVGTFYVNTQIEEKLASPEIREEVVRLLNQTEVRKKVELRAENRFNRRDYPVHVWIGFDDGQGHQCIDFYLSENGGFCSQSDWWFVREITNMEDLQPVLDLLM